MCSSTSSNYYFQMAEKADQNIHECVATGYSDEWQHMIDI
jgi:hypothetical protein